jgi:hypothetical protein
MTSTIETKTNPAALQPVEVYWTTDRAVDRLDVAHIGGSIRDRHATDEERAIAVWRYVHRTMYHYPMRNENHADQFDAAKLVNVYGYSYCTQQGIAAAAIAKAAGLKSRGIGVPGHGMYEVFYDGGWHAFCSISGFFVRTRLPDRHIASMQEMKDDPSLILKAREEKRVPVPFLPCAGGPEILGEKEGTKECPYALTYRHYDEKFFVEGVKKWRSLGAPNPSRYAAWLPLRRGESLRLDWGASGAFVPPKAPDRFHPPRHFCGIKDETNPFFPEIEGYGRKIANRMTYRYYGSGEHTWKPPLRRAGDAAQLARAENVRVSRSGITPADPAKPAIAEFEMTGPYVYVDGAVSGRVRVGDGGSLKVSFQGIDQEGAWKEIHAAARGDKQFSVKLGDAVLPDVPTEKKRRGFTKYRFRVRVELSGDAILTGVALTGTVQHNWSALPILVPGRNRIEVRTKTAPPKGLAFEIVWQEAGKERNARRRVKKSKEGFAVNVRGKSMPTMRYVLMTRE